MPEFTARAVRNHLVVPVRVERPDSAGCQRIVIKDAKRAKVFELRIIVITEREMPPAMETSVDDVSVDLVNAPGITNLYHGTASFPWIRTKHLLIELYILAGECECRDTLASGSLKNSPKRHCEERFLLSLPRYV
jgi:hypothetical protein